MSKRQGLAIFLIFLSLILLIKGMFKSQTFTFFDSKPTLKQVVEKSLEGSKGIYGVVIKDLKEGKEYSFNEKKSFESGSLYKLWVLITVYQKIEKGEIKEDEVLSKSIKELNTAFNISEEDAELKEGGISLSVKDAINQMITISHNYAALLLLQKVKTSEVAKFLENTGFDNSNVGEPPKTTPEDVKKLLEKIYKGELLNTENTQKVLEVLKKQQLNDGLPKYLPSGTQIGHKTGDIGWFKHDVGIVFKQEGDYIIVVMSETDSPLGAQERIAQISKAVYDYFELK